MSAYPPSASASAFVLIVSVNDACPFSPRLPFVADRVTHEEVQLAVQSSTPPFVAVLKR